MRALLVNVLVGMLMRTLRISVENSATVDALLEARSPFVLVFWHGSMLWPWWRFGNSNAAALVSMSSDGQLLADILRRWGYTVVRGSSSRGSKEAMQAMRDIIREGHILCVTPDGPRGPRHEMKMGAVRVAQTMRVPLVVVSVGYVRCRHLKSWDRFELPMPFSRCYVRFSEAVQINPDLEGEPLEDVRADLEKKMTAEYRSVALRGA
ncbi:MAG: lysophospholipid acyltransferase family protein [Bacteroidia bacterium]|nr:lysophospholipid acyltransferase family protein [Bacteroidia bacterium]